MQQSYIPLCADASLSPITSTHLHMTQSSHTHTHTHSPASDGTEQRSARASCVVVVCCWFNSPTAEGMSESAQRSVFLRTGTHTTPPPWLQDNRPLLSTWSGWHVILSTVWTTRVFQREQRSLNLGYLNTCIVYYARFWFVTALPEVYD